MHAKFSNLWDGILFFLNTTEFQVALRMMNLNFYLVLITRGKPRNLFLDTTNMESAVTSMKK